MINEGLIALDGDGVMLDYITAYANVWEKAFGEKPKLKDPNGYWALDRYHIPFLYGKELEHFHSFMDEEFWSTIPALPGAVEAAHRLEEYGHSLMCVTAIESKWEQARYQNLIEVGFPSMPVYGTGHEHHSNPKIQVLNHFKPQVFVDDYIVYHHGLHKDIHRALITRETGNSPNNHKDLREQIAIQSEHHNLEAFSKYWTDQGGCLDD